MAAVLLAKKKTENSETFTLPSYLPFVLTSNTKREAIMTTKGSLCDQVCRDFATFAKI